MKRVKGYVVAYDTKSGKLVWVVKVKDPSSQHNDQKFEVASLHSGTMLEKPGIDVTFRVEDFGSQREKVLKAVDVSIGKESPEASPLMGRTSTPLNYVFTMEEGKLVVWQSECSSDDEAQETYLGEHQQDAVLGLIKITPELVLKYGGMISDDEAVAGLAAVREMAGLDGIRDVLCAIAAEAFELGKRQR
jgi:hypothetical protein